MSTLENKNNQVVWAVKFIEAPLPQQKILIKLIVLPYPIYQNPWTLSCAKISDVSA